MPYRVTNNRTGGVFVGEDVRFALEVVLARHLDDRQVRTGIDALVSAVEMDEEALISVWAKVLNVSVSMTQDH